MPPRRKGKASMVFSEYKKTMDATPETEGLEFESAVFWLNMFRYPRILVSINNCPDTVIRVPVRVETEHGYVPPVSTISGKAFRGNETVTDIILPPGVSSLGKGAFVNCTHLKRITIPRKVKKIPEACFGNCWELEDVYYEGSREEWKQIEIVNEKYEVDTTGELIPGTPVEKLANERLTHIPGNEPLFCCNVHFNCDLGPDVGSPEFWLKAGHTDITDLFTVKE